MSSKPIPADFPAYSFPTTKELEEFFEREHKTAPAFYLKLAKKASGIPSVNAAEAVETALCFGWIDGWGRKIDDKWWFVRYTPRRAKSIWSQKNVSTVRRLIETGRMRPAGLAVVDAAKADGRWDRAYAGPSNITVPDDFAAALKDAPDAATFFESFNKTDRYSVLWRVQTASPTARAGRIEALVQMLSEKKRPTPFTKTVEKRKMGSEKVEDKKVEKIAKKKIKKEASKPRRSGLRSDPDFKS
ncbi:hypothetical protein N7448_000561 [Penicillium atrosanguineum]|uniref:Uncharacterized protein n=1 Tax=Penicillium atrosanguineum TaxID=1132637 RepID=A0A9W9Q3K5_9EURO|nr:Adrenodoxin [Penicillium atrosanguineum]KAJ5134417.1 hypothetical protein N7526_005782 [Penicillium atrosanguineum]KAJ5148983.1 hypothetical protein N7448_000561 [Penicillium atrosanguineum]KAJ5304299.1 Adrenodoxin [Penicillium atrosanguineum]KAJ5323774.1 hypothetical protein N7476_002374 [Penicillium atrosanguineum]